MSQPARPPPPPVDKPKAISDCLFNMLTQSNLISKTVPWDLCPVKGQNGVNLHRQGNEDVVYIALSMESTHGERFEAIKMLVDRLQPMGYMRYCSAFKVGDGMEQALAAFGTVNPGEDPNSADNKLLRDELEHLRALMGLKGPEAMAKALATQKAREQQK